MTTHTLQYGTTTIEYELLYAPRQTLAITVNPDCTVQVMAPEGCPLPQIERLLARRRKWIVKQQQELAQYLPLLPPRRYVSGETHLYLGKQYRLKLLGGHTPAMTLARNRFFIITRDKENKEAIQAQLDEWYRQKAEQLFAELLTAR
jgi:predicted metal-dependent hydrolase